MRKIYSFIILSVFTMAVMLVSGCATTNKIQDHPMGNSKHVLVFQFDDKSSYSYGKIPYDASEFMEEAFVRTGQVTLIPHDEWKSQITEDSLKEPLPADPIEQAISIGKLVGADVVVIGTIQQFSIDHDYDDDGPILSQRNEYSAMTRVKADVIDVANGQNITTVRTTGSAEKRALQFFKAGPFSVDAVHERTLLNEALQDATRQLAYKIVKQL